MSKKSYTLDDDLKMFNETIAALIAADMPFKYLFRTWILLCKLQATNVTHHWYMKRKRAYFAAVGRIERDTELYAIQNDKPFHYKW